MNNQKSSPENHRRYVRMDTVFPVRITLGKHLEAGSRTILRGYTQDVSRGGLRVEYDGATNHEATLIEERPSQIDVRIRVPFKRRPISAKAQIAWFERSQEEDNPDYTLGIAYSDINKKEADRILLYAKTRTWGPRLVGAFVLVFLLAAGGLVWYQHSLIQENRSLVVSLVEEAQKRQDMMLTLDALGDEEKALRQTLREYSESDEPEERENAIETELKEILERQSTYTGMLQAQKTEAEKNQQLVVKQLYSWITNHVKRETGLVPSYEGDERLQDVGFTYDQALVVIAHSLFGEFDQAERILSFYKTQAKKADGAYLTAYNTISGKPDEWNVHVGPNVWLGIAALQYQTLSGDDSFQGLAESIGSWLLKLQSQDPEKGLRGGPQVEWFSTEHNLDAYAFYEMLYKKTLDSRYWEAKEDLFEWLMVHAADRSAGRFKRGKGDATIATDTFSWSIAAIGPERLLEVDFDPEGIMEFAEEHCRVTVDFHRPDGKTVQITGLDFAKPQHVARGGIVSSEWTAQAVVTYRILADYFKDKGNIEKAQYYQNKVYFYLNELQKMIISSLSRTGQGKGCLPYSTMPNADTGHGWRTPHGDRTGSVAGTAYGIFAWSGFNPFKLSEFSVSPYIEES